MWQPISTIQLMLFLLGISFIVQIAGLAWLSTYNISSIPVLIVCNTFLVTFGVFSFFHYKLVRPFKHQIIQKSESEQLLLKLTTAIECTTSKIIITDKNGIIEYVNPALEQQTGYIRDEVIGKRTGFNKSGQTSHETYTDLWKTIEHGIVWKGELINRKKNGELVWDFVTISPIRNSEGLITNYLGIQQDISETKKIENALEWSQNLFRNIVLQNKTGIVILSVAKRVLFANPAAEQLLSCKNCLLPGKQFNVPINANGVTELRIISSPTKIHYTEITLTDTQWNGQNAELLMFHDITDRKIAENLIEEMAYHDKLTGLPNRALFLDRLNQTLHYAQRNSKIFAILFLDLDSFKGINDTLGHTIGDELLQQTADRLQKCVRKNDTVARLGGDEFIILLVNTRLDEDAGKVVAHINKSLQPPFFIDGHQLYVTSSIGISIFPKDGDNAEDLIKNADTAMYRAKELGRNNYQFFSTAIGEKAAHRLALEKHLHNAFEQNDFGLLFHPIVDLHKNTICAASVSIQWHHSSEKLIADDEFENFLEDTGLVVPVGEWILNSINQQLKSWQRNKIVPIKLYLKLTKRQLDNAEFFNVIKRINLHDNSKLFEFEVTDKVIQNTPSLCEKMQQLRKMDIGLCVTQFGTGRSPIVLLKRFPVNSIKIDSNLINEITTEDNMRIVETIISLSRHLDLVSIAHGIESKHQSELLTQNQCFLHQGNFYYPPMDIADLESLLLKQQHSSHQDTDQETEQNIQTHHSIH